MNDFQKRQLVDFIRNQAAQINELLQGFDCPIYFKPEIDATNPHWKDYQKYFAAQVPEQANESNTDERQQEINEKQIKIEEILSKIHKLDKNTISEIEKILNDKLAEDFIKDINIYNNGTKTDLKEDDVL